MTLCANHTRPMAALVLVSKSLKGRFMNRINPLKPSIGLQYSAQDVI